MQIKTQGIVLKQRNLGENDKIVTILSNTLGLIEATVRNVRAQRSVNASTSQILSYNDFCLYKGRSGYIVDTAECINAFYDLRLDVIKLSLAGYFCELTAHLCASDDHQAEDFLRLLLNTLHFLQEGSREPLLLKCIYELRAMSLAGFMPNLVCCSECASYEEEIMVFLPLDGIILCDDCFNKIATTGTGKIKHIITMSVLTAMRFILYTEPNRLFLFKLTGSSLSQLGFVAENYTLLHTEGRYKSLEMYRSLAAIL